MFKELWHKWLKNPEPEITEDLQQSQEIWWSSHGQEANLNTSGNKWVVGNRALVLEKENAFSVISSFLQSDKKNTFEQFRVHTPEGSLSFSPILADRALLVQLKEPLWLLPDTPVHATILSPTWIRISTSIGPLTEVSSQALRCSWSGSNPIQGDICYNSLVEIHFKPVEQWEHWQVMTPILFSNEDKEAILIKEFLLPHPFLTLYLKADGHLGTKSLHYQYETHEINLKLNVSGGEAPDQLLGARKDSAHQLKMRHLLEFMQPM
jgi:hypothetical protein